MGDAHAEHDGHGVAHYNKILGILMVLALVSYLGPEIGIKWITMLTAFGIAFVKAWLVIKHFMHLTVEKKYVNYMLITALAFMALFFAGTAPDVMNHRGRQWENVAAQAEVQRALAEAEAGGGHHGDHGEHVGDPEHEAAGHDDHAAH